MSPMWTWHDARAVVGSIASAIEPYACAATMVGSVAAKGFSHKDLDIRLDVSADGRQLLPRLLAAVDIIRSTERCVLVGSSVLDRLVLIDEAFRTLELWPSKPVAHLYGYREEVRARILSDRPHLVESIRRGRERGLPTGLEGRVPLEVFERERERFAAFLCALGVAISSGPE